MLPKQFDMFHFHYFYIFNFKYQPILGTLNNNSQYQFATLLLVFSIHFEKNIKLPSIKIINI